MLSANILPFQQSYCNKNLSIYEDKACKISNVKKKIFDGHTQFSRFFEVHTTLGGVYIRKLAPARVSYRHDFLISYRVYMMTGLFHI